MDNPKRARRVNYNRYFYLFVLPFVLVFCSFSLYPLLNTFALSFSDMAGFDSTYRFVGLKNYSAMIRDVHFYGTIWNVVRIWVFNFVPQLGVALVLAAWFTDIRLKMKGVGVFKAVLFLPYLLTAVSVAMLFGALFAHPSGAVNQVLVRLGVLNSSFDFLRSKPASILIVSFIQFWMYVGYTLVMFMAGITGIPATLYEAALVDGAGLRTTFFRVTLPLLKPIILYLMIMTIVGGLQIFEIPYVIGGMEGSPDGVLRTISMYIYSTAFKGSNNYAYAATMSVGLFALILLLSAFAFRVLGDREGGEK